VAYNCHNLLIQLMELQFTAIDLNLFLDTHPDNQEALRDYEKSWKNFRLLWNNADRLLPFPFITSTTVGSGSTSPGPGK